jgi:DNA helicase-2/ATP-dependent DNA helicase PcrA
VAAPGSGKTAVITSRIKALLREGFLPSEIFATTFTREGSEEMAARIGQKTERLIYTFHAWALHFIKKELHSFAFELRPWPMSPLEQARILSGLCRASKKKWKDAANFISLMKRRGVTPEESFKYIEKDDDEVFCSVYARYEQVMYAEGALDFDSMVIETARLLERRADVRERNQYRQVMVDEAQDTDSIQWRIVKAISEAHGNVLAVGDENQGMYSFRGSESNLTEYFLNLFPGATVYPLPVNYRSTKAIVEYCKGIAPIQNETVTQLSTPNDQGVDPVFKLFSHEDEEAKQVLNMCVDPRNTAILARTNRQIAPFERECAERGLKYKLLGKSGFWGQQEVKDLIAIIGACSMPSDNNIKGMLGARSEVTRFLKKGPGGAVDSLIRQQGGSVGHMPLSKLLIQATTGDHRQDDILRDVAHACRAVRQMPTATAAVETMDERFGITRSYDEVDNESKVDNDPRENIKKVKEYALRYRTIGDFYDWIQRLLKAKKYAKDCLTLSTIHQSKGKEWDNVFVVGVNSDVLPHIRGEETEERRIYFVACSRAAKRLQVSANGIASILIRDRVQRVDAADIATVDPWEGWALQ